MIEQPKLTEEVGDLVVLYRNARVLKQYDISEFIWAKISIHIDSYINEYIEFKGIRTRNTVQHMSEVFHLPNT